MEKFTYRPQNVCPVAISFDLDGDTVHNISFSGGCSGNLKAISKLLEGKTVDEIETALKGNTCGNKPTSCADQLAKSGKSRLRQTIGQITNEYPTKTNGRFTRVRFLPPPKVFRSLRKAR